MIIKSSITSSEGRTESVDGEGVPGGAGEGVEGVLGEGGEGVLGVPGEDDEPEDEGDQEDQHEEEGWAHLPEQPSVSLEVC